MKSSVCLLIMSRNITWCLLSNLLKKSNCAWRLSLRIPKRFEHAQRGYVAADSTRLNFDYHDDQVLSYGDYLDEHERGQVHAVRTLMRLLDITRAEAMRATKNWMILSELSKRMLMENFEALRAAGAFKSLLRQKIYALADNTGNIKLKIDAFKQIGLEINYAIPLLTLSALQLNLFAFITKTDRKIILHYKNRLDYLADKLNCHVSVICEVVAHHPRVLTLDIAKVVAITEFLIDDIGMPSEDILSGFNIYLYPVETIKERLRRAKAAGMQPLKPWIVRCKISTIEKAEKKKEIWKKLVGPSATLEEYISKLMDCEESAVLACMTREPYLKTIHIEKLTDNLKFIKECEYTIEDLYRSPRLLRLKKENIQQKYHTWINHGLKRPCLSTFAASNKIFNEKLQSALKAKKMNADES